MIGHVDAHHHVWSLARGDYGWLTPALAPIYRDFSLQDALPLFDHAKVAASVLVQAAPTVAETRYLLEVARRSDGVVQGVVGWVDFAAPDAIPTLTRLARDPLLKGVRPMLQDLPDPAWILRT
jgi:L-fuconolactonase